MAVRQVLGKRQLASRSLTPVGLDMKRLLLASRRPRWHHAPPRSGRTCAARTAMREDSVQKMFCETKEGVARKDSAFAFAACDNKDIAEEAGILAKAEACLGKRTAAHKARQMNAERIDRLAVVGPPPAVKLCSLLEAPPRKKKEAVCTL